MSAAATMRLTQLHDVGDENGTRTNSLGIGPGGAGMLSDLRGHPAASDRDQAPHHHHG